MLSGPPNKNEENSNKPFFSTITHDFSLIRLKFQDHLEKKIMSVETQDEKEKQNASDIQKRAIKALKGKWEKLCREFDNPKLDVKDSNYANLYNTVGCLFKASQLPDYITQEDLIKFSNSDPTRFLAALDSGKNNSFLVRLGDIEKFKAKLTAHNQTGGAFDSKDEMNKKLDELSLEQKRKEIENILDHIEEKIKDSHAATLPLVNITQKDLITFANSYPAQFLAGIKKLEFDKNNSFLARLDDLEKFKNELETQSTNLEKDQEILLKEIQDNEKSLAVKLAEEDVEKSKIKSLENEIKSTEDKINAIDGNNLKEDQEKLLEEIKNKKELLELAVKEKNTKTSKIKSLENEIKSIEEKRNAIIDKRMNINKITEKLGGLIEQKKQKELEHPEKPVSQTDTPVNSSPTHTQAMELTLAEKIVFKLINDSNTLEVPETIKDARRDAMRAAADNLLHVLDESKNRNYYKDILDELQTIKEAVPGTSTQEYRQMVYAAAEQATASALNNIDKEMQENPESTNNAEKKSNNILSYLEALKIKWEVEQRTFKFEGKNKVHHNDRMKYLENCINTISANKDNPQELTILLNISTALGTFNKVLENIPRDFRNTKGIRENLSRLKEEYIVPNKSAKIQQGETSEAQLKESASNPLQRKTSTAAMFSLFTHRRQPSHEAPQNSDDLRNTMKPTK
jgi:hypothetical protein